MDSFQPTPAQKSGPSVIDCTIYPYTVYPRLSSREKTNLQNSKLKIPNFAEPSLSQLTLINLANFISKNTCIFFDFFMLQKWLWIHFNRRQLKKVVLAYLIAQFIHILYTLGYLLAKKLTSKTQN